VNHTFLCTGKIPVELTPFLVHYYKCENEMDEERKCPPDIDYKSDKAYRLLRMNEQLTRGEVLQKDALTAAFLALRTRPYNATSKACSYT
jgi:hypothetical protein